MSKYTPNFYVCERNNEILLQINISGNDGMAATASASAVAVIITVEKTLNVKHINISVKNHMQNYTFLTQHSAHRSIHIRKCVCVRVRDRKLLSPAQFHSHCEYMYANQFVYHSLKCLYYLILLSVD